MYLVPHIKDARDCLLGAMISATLDFMSAYLQIHLREEDIERTALVFPEGLFEFTQMPFSLKNAGAMLQ